MAIAVGTTPLVQKGGLESRGGKQITTTSGYGQVQANVWRRLGHVLPRFISVSRSLGISITIRFRFRFGSISAISLHLNRAKGQGRRQGGFGKNCEKFVTEAFCLLSFALVTDTRLPVKSSKHDVRGLIFSPFPPFLFFLFLPASQPNPVVPPFLDAVCELYGCTIFYIFMHDAFNHVMHMIFSQPRGYGSEVMEFWVLEFGVWDLGAFLIYSCIQFHQHELCFAYFQAEFV